MKQSFLFTKLYLEGLNINAIQSGVGGDALNHIYFSNHNASVTKLSVN